MTTILARGAFLRQNAIRLNYYRVTSVANNKPILLNDNFKRNNSSMIDTYAGTLIQSTPVQLAARALVSLHDSTGLPWWATVVVATLGLRVCFSLPLTIFNEYNMVKCANLAPELKEIAKSIGQEVAIERNVKLLTEAQSKTIFKRKLREQSRQLYLRENCHPVKSLLTVFLQIPVWISMTCALRGLTYSSLFILYFFSEGTLWFPSLASPDPQFILPVLFCSINFLNIELFRARNVAPELFKQKLTTNSYRVLTLLIFPVAAVAPSAVTLYWTCSASMATAQALLIVSPKFRRLVRIPKTHLEMEKPYSTMFERFKRNFVTVKQHGK